MGNNGETKALELSHRNDSYKLMQRIRYYERQSSEKLKYA